MNIAILPGLYPIHTGDPGYGRHLDRDGDGIGCE
ncbi:excalibur calcium-binding domain-containing protein [Streptomyces sp. NPDC088251]